jgi:predicted amidohydrolase
VSTPAARRAWAFAPEDPLASDTLGRLAELSRAEPHAVVVAGGTPELAPDGKLFNSCVAITGGRVAAIYRKLHLFDADLRASAGDAAVWRESDGTSAGDRAVLVRTPRCAIGLSICYDLRFAALFRALGEAGAELFVVPAAFTVPTGQAHWEVLLRARAVENMAYVVAPAQGGTHASGRRTYGHTMIVDPWGEVLAARAEDGEGVVLAEIDTERMHEMRRRLGW